MFEATAASLEREGEGVPQPRTIGERAETACVAEHSARAGAPRPAPQAQRPAQARVSLCFVRGLRRPGILLYFITSTPGKVGSHLHNDRHTGTQTGRSVCVDERHRQTAGDGIQRKGKARAPHFPGSCAAGVVGAMQSGFPSHFTRSAFGEAKAEGDGEAAVVATLLPRLSARM